ncbi:MAG TPA: RHS repeat-associated core domain-containing protein [Acidobacteriota bacterium]|nr:RHS repeat-associated core domain-containing protein [Acidobacteriota bacterium]
MSATECDSFSLADFTLKQTTFEPFHEDTQFSASDENPLVAYKVRVNFEGNLPLPESECKWTHVGFCYDRPYVEWIHGSFTGNFNADGAPIVTVEWAAAGPLSSTVYDLWRNGKYEIYDISGNSITFAIGGHPDSIDVTHEFGVRAVNLLDGCLSDLVTCTVTVPGDLTECPPEAGEILIKTNIVGPEYNANGDLVGIQIQLVWSGETGSYIKILRSFEGCDGNFSEIGSVSVTQNYFYSTLQSGQIATYKVVSGRNNCDLVGESDCYTINVTPMTGLNEGTVYFYVKDHLGNTRLVLDRDGYIQSRMDYEPYGIELYPLAANSSREKYKFTNQERDYTTGLDYFHARYYSSAMGRFMGADSIAGTPEYPQSWNLYGYVRNNPLNATDPTGMLEQILGHYMVTYLIGIAVNLNNGANWGDAVSAANAFAGDVARVDDENPATPFNRDWFHLHFMTSSEAWAGANGPATAEQMHSRQDVPFHRENPNPDYKGLIFDFPLGHGLAGKAPDKLAKATDEQKKALIDGTVRSFGVQQHDINSVLNIEDLTNKLIDAKTSGEVREVLSYFINGLKNKYDKPSGTQSSETKVPNLSLIVKAL